MAKIFDFAAFRRDRHLQAERPLTRNQEILAEIQALWAARTPEEIRMAEIRGTEEELRAVQRRYDRLIEGVPLPGDQSASPSQIAKNDRTYDPRQSNEQDHGHEL
jgi:hypothetical protein